MSLPRQNCIEWSLYEGKRIQRTILWLEVYVLGYNDAMLRLIVHRTNEESKS
jgi:hypothetical protein